MRLILFFLGTLIFPTGIITLYMLLAGYYPSAGFSFIFPFFSILVAIGYLAMILHATFNGWREKDLKAITKISLALCVIKVIFIFLFGGGNFWGELLGMRSAGGTQLGLGFLAWVTLNVAGNYVYALKPKQWVLIAWIAANLAAGIALVLMVWEPERGSFTLSAIQVFSRLGVLGILLLFTFRHYALRKKWPAYIQTGDSLIAEQMAPPQVVLDEERIKRLTHPQLLVRIGAAETLQQSETPEAIPALAKALEGAPLLYLTQEATVAMGWKALKKVAATSLQNIKARNQPYLKAYPQVYCTRDRKWAVKETTPGGTEYVLCPICRKHDALAPGISQVIGWIGQPPYQTLPPDGLGIPVWDTATQQIIPTDLTSLEIYTQTPGLHADWAVSAFVQGFQNDIHNKERKIPIQVDQPSLLSANTLTILHEIQLNPTPHEPQEDIPAHPGPA